MAVIEKDSYDGSGAAAPLTDRDLYDRQARLLKTFLEHGAISREQYEKSMHDMTEKMGKINDAESI